MSFENVFRKAFERLNQPGRTSKNLWLNSFEGFRSHFVKTMIFETSKNSQETSKNTQETSEKSHVYDHFFFSYEKLGYIASIFEHVRNSTFQIRRSKFDVRNSTFEIRRSKLPGLHVGAPSSWTSPSRWMVGILAVVRHSGNGPGLPQCHQAWASRWSPRTSAVAGGKCVFMSINLNHNYHY